LMDLDPQLIHGSLNPPQPKTGSAVFAGLTTVTDRPTDHASRFVTYVVEPTAVRPNNNSKEF